MNSILYIDDTGKAELYDDDYNITIFCKDEQEQQRAMKRLEVANRMRWYDAKTDPPEDSRDVIVYRDGIGSVMGFFDHEIHCISGRRHSLDGKAGRPGKNGRGRS